VASFDFQLGQFGAQAEPPHFVGIDRAGRMLVGRGRAAPQSLGILFAGFGSGQPNIKLAIGASLGDLQLQLGDLEIEFIGPDHVAGDGSGDALVKAFADHPNVPEHTTLALWRSDKDGKPTNGGSGDPVAPGLTQEIPGPLRICTKNALHGTTSPGQWKGERWWVVALHEPVVRQDDKIASLKRTIVCECT